MKNITIITLLLVGLSSCSKDEQRKESELNGQYFATLHYHRVPYRSGPADTVSEDFDTVLNAMVTITGYEDTITMSYSPGVDAPKSFVLSYTGTANDTILYSQTYIPEFSAGYGLPSKKLYYSISNKKIYYREVYQSGHDGSYLLELQQN